MIELYVAWDRIGWVATTSGTAAKSSPCSGPRQAAHELAVRHFGHPAFTLQQMRRGLYTATEKTTRPHFG